MTLMTTTDDACPDCGAPLHDTSWAQPALLRHGGCGATEHVAIVACTCGYRRHHTTRTTRP